MRNKFGACQQRSWGLRHESSMHTFLQFQILVMLDQLCPINNHQGPSLEVCHKTVLQVVLHSIFARRMLEVLFIIVGIHYSGYPPNHSGYSLGRPTNQLCVPREFRVLGRGFGNQILTRSWLIKAIKNCPPPKRGNSNKAQETPIFMPRLPC